jgi:hypothetical protein
MKNLLYIILLALIPVLGQAQKKATVKQFFHKYKKYESATGMTIPGFLVGMGLGFIQETDMKPFKRFAKRIKQVRFLSIEAEQQIVTQKDYKQLVSVINVSHFEELITFRSEGETFQLYIKEWKEKVKGIFVIMKGAESFTFVEIKSNIRMKDINLLINELIGTLKEQLKSKGEGEQSKEIEVSTSKT